jgi:protein-S-isoprenylcysteine O-methyltransferase Ste14
MSAFGAVLVVAGGALAARSALLLIGRGRPRRGPQPAFVVAGPYRRMRNPLLAGLLVAATGLAFASGSYVLALATVAVALAAHVWIIRVEEPRLTVRFGDAYRVYLRRVPRWLPRAPSGDDDQLEV